MLSDLNLGIVGDLILVFEGIPSFMGDLVLTVSELASVTQRLLPVSVHSGQNRYQTALILDMDLNGTEPRRDKVLNIIWVNLYLLGYAKRKEQFRKKVFHPDPKDPQCRLTQVSQR